jgi:hypothetical protein
MTDQVTISDIGEEKKFLTSRGLRSRLWTNTYINNKLLGVIAKKDKWIEEVRQ